MTRYSMQCNFLIIKILTPRHPIQLNVLRNCRENTNEVYSFENILWRNHVRYTRTSNFQTLDYNCKSSE
jgi:hypothetical protein